MTLIQFDPSLPNITVTKAAQDYFIGQLKKSHGDYVRICVKKSGCTGFKYVVDLDKSADEDDHIQILGDGLMLRVDRLAMPYINGTEIDLVREGLNKHIRFNNPNIQDECGCGESFSVKPVIHAV